MAVVLPNTQLSVSKRAHPYERDPHGKIVGSSEPGPRSTPKPGHVTEPFDGAYSENQWVLRVDPAEWPIGDGDLVHDEQSGQTFVIRYARLHSVPGGYGYVDYIRVSADLNPPNKL